MKILFIWPNFECPVGLSIGISYLSSALKKAGHDTQIIHINERLEYPLSFDKIESDALSYQPDLIAFSTDENHYQEMGQLSKRLKEKIDRPIVFGGIYTTLNTKTVMEENPWVDFANVGEGDDSIIDLVAALENGKNTSCVPNMWAREQGKIISNLVRPLKDIATLPWMDLQGWQFKRITELRRGWVNISMNRGCPYRCAYCHNNGVAKVLQANFKTPTSGNVDIGYLRFRGIDDMIGELKSILEKYDFVRAFSFIDDTFTMNHQHIKSFLIRYKKEIGVPFICNTNVMDVDKEILELLKEANCALIRFGVEAASRRIRKDILKRNFSIQKTEEIFKICRSIGLRSLAFNILANPTESRQDMLDTLRLNSKILPDALRVSLGYPYVGTDYHQVAKELQQIDEGKHIHNYLWETKLKWTDDNWVWIDKVHTIYWWWINAYLQNEASDLYAQLTKLIEAMPQDRWMSSETKQQVLELDVALSCMLKALNITHYVASFKDRPDISVLYYYDGPKLQLDRLNKFNELNIL